MIRGETARLEKTDFELKILNFELRPLTSWNGPEVKYQIVAGGKTYGSPPYWFSKDAPPYFVTLVESDYLSFAKFKIELPETECVKRAKDFPESIEERDICLQELATRLNKEKYCIMVSDQSIKNNCYVSLAYNLRNQNLCYKISEEEKRQMCLDNLKYLQ